VRFGVTLPNLGVDGGPRQLVGLAEAAEAAGWDGVFFWDTFGSPDYDRRFGGQVALRAPWDVWSLLSAVATRTTRVRLGTLLTPVTRRRPWKLAAEAATVDQLSGGRLVLSVGLGWVPDAALTRAGETLTRKVRAERLDEGLEIATALWSREQVTFSGRHFDVESLPGIPSVQRPRIPVWVVGAWPEERSLARVVRFDGLLPTVKRRIDGTDVWIQPSAEELVAVTADLRSGGHDALDVVVEGHTSRDPARAVAKVAPYADAGATWWLESIWGLLDTVDQPLGRMLERIRLGPPRSY
jgi:hypothetical protein